eukprot:TRINITY_DN20990_c0_g1_i5.p2 TRINITY_DN20990_c0_g1~~TRINITY_DN20990_c0_g1_i5.p2  ORF type:complete len:149 (-),score=30.80 TRINITY_DN20990_c0_g1_i5:127-573(-)
MRSDSFPVLKPNEALQAELARLGAEGRPICVLSMFEPTLPSITKELKAMGGDALKILPIYVPHGLDQLNAGDEDACIATIAAASVSAVKDVEEKLGQKPACVALAMFSMARARKAAQAAVDELGVAGDVPVLTSPDAAVLQMKSLLGH